MRCFNSVFYEERPAHLSRAGLIHSHTEAGFAAVITPSAPCGRGDGGQPEHDGRSWSPSGHGSHAPCCAGASWADKYGTWSTLLTDLNRFADPGEDPVPRTSYNACPHCGQPNKYIRMIKRLSSLFWNTDSHAAFIFHRLRPVHNILWFIQNPYAKRLADSRHNCTF